MLLEFSLVVGQEPTKGKKVFSRHTSTDKDGFTGPFQLNMGVQKGKNTKAGCREHLSLSNEMSRFSPRKKVQECCNRKLYSATCLVGTTRFIYIT